jgi:polysaccharide export outer membrane protein
MNRIITLLISAVLLGACAQTAPTVKPTAQKTISQQEVLENLTQVRTSSTYTLQPGDLVEIKVFQEDNMSRTVRVDGNSKISFPLVGTLSVKDCSLEMAEQRLVSRLKDYIKNPQVSILIKEYGNKTIYVLGQVKKPAAIQLPPEKSSTVLEAITSAGGFTDIANTSKVRVLRMENGKQTSLDVDVSQITKQGDKSLDITLMPGDVIFVPQSMF